MEDIEEKQEEGMPNTRINTEDIEKAVEIAKEIIEKKAAGDPSIKQMMSIVHKFIQKQPVICYGGTAINNILPKEKQFYNPDIDIPDYDFFSETPQEHCIQLCKKLKKAGLQNIEAKPGLHLGTFKVFCEFIGVADISAINKDLFRKLWSESIVKDKIHYSPPNFLRMNVYLELSRPMGDVSRWVKVYKRLELLNSEYPIECPSLYGSIFEESLVPKIKEKIEDLLIKEKVILLGFNGSLLQEEKQSWKLPLDLLVEEANVTKLTKQLIEIFGKGIVKSRSYEEYAEILPAHTDIVEGNVLFVRIYETMACHSYHELKSGLHIASIPTLLNFFFGMLYADKEFLQHTTRQRIICTAQRLIQMAKDSSKRKFKLLTPITCLGKQKELLDMRKERNELYEKTKSNKTLFRKYFFSYKP
jgi:hypothetical protein